MAKLTLDDVVNLESETTALGTINNNSDLIEDALDNTISRDGTSPNQMMANLDMNGNWVINHPAPRQDTDLVRVKDIGVGGNITITNNNAAAIPFSAVGTISSTNVQSAVAEVATDAAAATATVQTNLDSDVTTLQAEIDAIEQDVDDLQDALTAGAAGRTRLSANITFYVRTDGNDANDGLTNTAGGAFKTIMAAYHNMYNNYDINSNSVVIQVGAGTYNEQLQIFGHPLGTHVFQIKGDTTTPSNCVINVGVNEIGCYCKDYGCVQLNGLKFTGGNGAQAITADQFGIIDIQNCDMGAHPNGRHFTAQNFGVVNIDQGTLAITGDCLFPFICQNGGGMNVSAVATITIGSARAFNTFCFCDTVSRSTWNTTVGGAGVAGTTGVRYNSIFNSVINTQGGGANFFPGNSGGTTATGGIYI